MSLHVFPRRVRRPPAETEGPDPRCHPQHRCGEAAPTGRSQQHGRLGLEEAAPLLHEGRQMLRHTYGGRTIQLHVRIPGVSGCPLLTRRRIAFIRFISLCFL